jgi:hypothetical protein
MVKGALVANITRNRTTNDNRKVTKLEIIVANEYMYFGT